MRKLARTTFLLSTIILLILLSLPVAALADGGGEENELTQTINGYEVTLVFENPATIGENQIHIRVSDAQHTPIANADVEVSVVKGEAEHGEAEPADQHDEPTDQHDEPAAMPGMEGMSEQPASMPGMSDAPEQPAAMPGMEGMSEQPVEASSEAHDEMEMVALEAGHESGEYAGEIHIEGDGAWVVRVHLTIQGEQMEVEFPLSIVSRRYGAGILAGFFVVNATIIGTALVLKSKKASAKLATEA